MKKIFFLFWLILGALSLSSCTEEEEITQGDIVGVVTDAANGTQPLSGVQVSILPNGASTSTGSDGKFSFPKLEAGEYKIQFMKEGYETNSKSVTVVPGQVSKSDPEKVEKDIQDLIEIVKRNSEDEDEKVKSYEILNEEQSKTGKWVRITYKLTNVDGTENTSDFYLTKDDTGEWKIQMFGTDRLMDE